MKIDGNLRQAIRSAFNAQPETDWKEVSRQKQEAIEKWMDTSRGKRAKQIVTRLRKLRRECNTLSEELCKTFGLSASDKSIEIGSCDGSKERYLKMGGTLPERAVKWNFDAKMAEVANASEADAKIILQKIGIRWE